ncbi:MAG: hypothetical protein ABI867_34140 [Kofleriaceae bacterium]
MRFIGCLVAVLACSGHTGEPDRPRGSGAHGDAGVTGVAPSSRPTELECETLVGHVVGLKMTELRATKPADQLPTDADATKLTAELRADPGCRSLPRDRYRCAIATKTLAELEGCYLTPSSSTSNSSVAPGGMTPPAPRSP